MVEYLAGCGDLSMVVHPPQIQLNVINNELTMQDNLLLLFLSFSFGMIFNEYVVNAENVKCCANSNVVVVMEA